MEYISAQFLSDTVMPWFLTSGLRILGILVGLYILHRITKRLSQKLIRKLVEQEEGGTEEEEKRREDTLIGALHTTMHIVVLLVGAMMIMSELGIDTGPLLAAAGLGGLAFGFGGQYLIKDLINGVFILFENQFRVDDVAQFGDKIGVVEDINLRRTIIRDLDGTVHNIPNGSIDIASNLSKNYGNVHIDIGVAYDTNLDKAIEVINRTGIELSEDPEWKGEIKEAPQFLRVNQFGDSAILLKVMGKTEPLEQWATTGEFRKRIKMAFDKEGIEIPFPQRVVHQANEDDDGGE